MSPLDDEARRLTANWLNIVAASAISIGGLTPFATMFVAGRDGREVEAGRLAVTVVVFFMVGLLLHLGARAALPRPRRE